MSNIDKDKKEQSENIAVTVAKFTIKALKKSKEKIPCSVYIVGKTCIISFD